MSKTHHEMSASGSIVVVDSSGNVNISKSNAPQSQQHFQRQLQNQQVILNDDYINADGLMTGGVNYITTNDLINNAQIIKFVTEEEAAIIGQQQYHHHHHHQDDQMYGAMTSHHQPVHGLSNPNSKVHVISNVTIVSKPQHSPHTISFVNSRHLPQGGNFVNTYISKQNCGKLVPYHQSPPHQNHQQQILTKHAQASNQITQKLNMPRIVTRVQTISAQQQSGNNIVMSRNTNVAPITSVIQSHQVQKNQHSMQLVPMTKSTHNLRNRTVTNAVSSSLKVVHTKPVQQSMPPSQPKLHSLPPKGRNSKVVKSYSSTPSSSIYQQQQQQQQEHQMKSMHLRSGHIINNNTINTNKMLQLQHYQQHHHPPPPPQRAIANNVYIHGSPVPKVNKSKYMVQKQNQNQMAQVVLPIQHQVQKSSYQQHSQGFIGAGGSNIKYVNAQGNVIASSGRARAVMQQSVSPYQQTQSLYHLENTMSPVIPQDLQSTSSGSKCSTDDMMIVNGTHMSDEMSARILQSLSKNSAYNSSTRHSNSHQNQSVKMSHQGTYLKSTNTDQYAVLTQQHSVHNAQHHQHQHQQQQQQQQLTLYNHRVASEQALSAVKYGPEYFRVNTCDIQSSTASFVDNIPLVSTRDSSVTYNSHDQDEDIVGEETRPKPISSVDPHLKSLYGFLNDHNYCPAITENTEQILKKCHQKAVPVTTTVTPPKPVNSTYSYVYKPAEKDEDVHSVISTSSRAGGNHDIDLGEETETAAEGEDDSITRCICDYEHDDGYMIQCDKCTSWQHVDCMGIDRQNIPDKYKCEICEPRPVDKSRARTLQCQKYKEQQSFLLLSAQAQQPYPVENATVHSTTGDRNLLNNNNFSSLPAIKKPQRQVSAAKRKAEMKDTKRKRGESTSRANGKRREPKKVSKRKTSKQQQMQQQPESGDKHAAHLRSWIENYESAVTNHYSPELRARLHAISKQQQYQSIQLPQLKNISHLEGRCTTVPHAGGKILISTLDLSPHNAISEMRGKYMLTAQYKQQPVFPPTNAKQGGHRNPGPFIFFYRLPNEGPEICVDTRTYGNDARFVRRSCRPNAEILHTIEKGTIHLYIVSLANIKSSTEITIKHEPHDLAALSRGTITAPTSSMCACGLTKDCLFAPPAQTPPPQPITTKSRSNGNLKEDSAGTVNKKPAYRRSKNSSIGRGRSTSSSCESNTALLSPKHPAASPTVNMMHDSGVCTSSSSSPPLQSPLCNPPVVTTPLNSPHSEPIPLPPLLQQQPQPVQKQPQEITQSHTDPMNALVPVTTQSLRQLFQKQNSVTQPLPAQANKIEPKINSSPAPVVEEVAPQAPIQQKKNASPVKSPMKSPMRSPMKSPMRSPMKSPIRPTSLSIDDTVAPATPTKEKSKVQVTPSIKSPPIGPTRSTAAGRKTPRKSSCSFSEDEHPKKDSSPTKKVEDKKLTREEKKIQAIVRAFEKMEKNQQRKRELQHKSSTPTSATPPMSSPSAKRRRSSSPKLKRRKDDDRTPAKKSGNQVRRKKRKASKSYQQTNHQRKRTRSRINSDVHSGDSDAMTSEDSASLLSPTLLGHVPPTIQTHHIKRDVSPKYSEHKSPKYSEHKSPKYSEHKSPKYSEHNSSDVGSAAGMLMTLSNCKVEDGNSAQSPSLPELPKPSSSAFSLSSALMLVEAAVGPLEQTRSLENEFKMPAKTKKTIMNEWLHQADTVTHLHRENELKPQFHHQMSYPPMLSVAQVLDDVEHQNTFTHQQLKGIFTNSSPANSPNNINKYIITEMPFQEEPQNLSIVTKRVEEFININSQDDEDEHKWSMDNSTDDSSIPQPLPTPPMQKGSSVKKRWLRQAISEECSDDITTSPPNGYMTPLKKRRMARECQDMMRQMAGENSATLSPQNYLGPSDILPINSSIEVKVNQERFKIIDVKEEKLKIEDEIEEKASPNFDVDEESTAHTSGDNSNEPDFESKKEEQEDFNQSSSGNNFKFKVATDNASSGNISKACQSSDDEQTDSKADVLTEIKVEQANFKPNPNIDDFDIKPLNEVTETSSMITDEQKEVNITDEIEDIQKRLLSFHDTNIMILKSRNKKRTPTQEDDSESVEHPRKSGKQLRFDIESDQSIKEEILPVVESVRESEKVASTSIPELPASESMDWSHNDLAPAVLSAATIPSFNQPILPYSSYLMNGINQSIFPPQATNETPTSHTPEVVSNMPSTPVKSLLSEYLENPNKPSSNHGFAMSDTPRLLSMFNVHTPTSSRTLNSGYLTRDTTMSSNAQPSTATTVPIPLPAPAKIYSRTQSADPRLNPSLLTPVLPPAPKKKLSINEYRKRKQLSSDSEKTSPIKMETNSNRVTTPILPRVDTTCEKTENVLVSPISKKSSDDKVAVFSPAPTLLERQQESLSLRLKNYKSSLRILPNTTTRTRSEKKDVLDSITRIEMTSPLSSSNSSLTSVSSSNSESSSSPKNEKFNERLNNESEDSSSPSESTSR